MMKRTFTLAALSLSFIQCSQAREDDSVPREDRVPRQVVMAPVAAPVAATASRSNIASRTTESDLELAQRFAPVILNEDRSFKTRAGQAMTYWDNVDAVFYDVSQTATHVYISYQVMKSASKNIETESRIETAVATTGIGVYVMAFGGWKPLNTYHPVDSEDLLVVLEKKENNGLEIVTYATNLHGKRLIYPNRKIVEASEQSKYEDHTSGYEMGLGSSFFTTPGIQEILDMKRNDMATLNGRPFIASGAGSHSLSAARIDLTSKRVVDRLKTGKLRISAVEGTTQLDGVSSPITGYKLRSVKSVVEEMKFASSLIALNTGKDEDKAAPCYSFKMSLNGKEVQNPELPTHIDPRWYLKTYNPYLLKLTESRIAANSKEAGLLDMPEADFFYAHEREPNTDRNGLLDCQRLDPAASFEAMYPATFKAQGGSKDYTRYELLDAKAAAYQGRDR